MRCSSVLYFQIDCHSQGSSLLSKYGHMCAPLHRVYTRRKRGKNRNIEIAEAGNDLLYVALSVFKTLTFACLPENTVDC